MQSREVSLQCRLRDFAPMRENLVAFLLDAMGAAGAEGEVGVRIVSARTMAGLNRRFRGKPGPTDVLSFPAEPGEDVGLAYLGDIAICGPVAAEAAGRGRNRIEGELKRLLLHGLLHLLGYDHETDGGKMARRERALRKSLGILEA
jgi:probable rRNA maturation factor